MLLLHQAGGIWWNAVLLAPPTEMAWSVLVGRAGQTFDPRPADGDGL